MDLNTYSDHVALKEALGALTKADPVIADLAGRYGVPVLDKKSLTDFTVEGEETLAGSVDDRLFCEIVYTSYKATPWEDRLWTTKTIVSEEEA